MKTYVILAWLCTCVAFTAKAEPLVTISCEKPEGSSITYGVPLTERLDALRKEQPAPINPTLRGPTKNEYQGKPTFVIDSNRKKLPRLERNAAGQACDEQADAGNQDDEAAARLCIQEFQRRWHGSDRAPNRHQGSLEVLQFGCCPEFVHQRNRWKSKCLA